MLFDVQTVAIVCLFVAVSAALLLFISVVVTREKTYEEAIAEQRQQANALLAGAQPRPRPREKKQRKAGRKVKERAGAPPADQEADGAEAEREEPAVAEEPVAKKDDSPRREAAEAAVSERPDGEEEPQEAPAAKPQTAESATQTVPAAGAPPAVQQATQTNGLVAPKEKRRKRTEQSVIEQLTADKDGPNLQLVTSMVRKAELSRSEVQTLIDMLLNKQHEAPAVVDEWSEGRADPVQRLKRQLAERERQLAAEQEALAGAQAKLREVRGEQAAERLQLQQRARALEEALGARRLELQAAAARLSAEAAGARKLADENQAQAQQVQLVAAGAREKELAAEGALAQLRRQVAALQADADRKDGYVATIEEAQKELERRCGAMQRQEAELQLELSQATVALQKQLDELQAAKRCQEECDRVVVQLKSDVRRLEESEGASLDERKAHHVELRNLQNELSSVRQQLQEAERTHGAENNETAARVRLEEERRDGELTRLQATVDRYRGIIDDTEGTLDELQERVEREETLWGGRLAAKEAELEAAAAQLRQLREQVEELRGQIASERDERRRLSDENDVHVGSLNEDIDGLTRRLDESEKRNGELRLRVDSLSSLAVKAIGHGGASNGPAVAPGNDGD